MHRSKVNNQKRGLINAILKSYTNFPDAFLRQKKLAEGEKTVLLYAFLSSIFLFMAQLPNQLQNWYSSSTKDPLINFVGVLFFVALFFTPLLLYAVCTIIHVLLKVFGARGSFFDLRLAFFWSLIIAAPALVLAGMVKGYLPNIFLSEVVNGGANILLAWIMSNNISLAEEFKSPLPLFVFLILVYFCTSLTIGL